MLQIVLSFCAGVYVGTEYEMMPYVEKVKATLRGMEKKPADTTEVPETVPPASWSWFSWGGSSTKKKD